MIDSFQGEYAFLSNFAASEIEFEGIVFPTVEHAFQAAKTLNITKRKEIAALPTPGQAKRAGRSVELRPDWEDIKIDVIAFNVHDEDDLAQLQCTANVTGGRFTEADTKAELFRSMEDLVLPHKNVEATLYGTE